MKSFHTRHWIAMVRKSGKISRKIFGRYWDVTVSKWPKPRNLIWGYDGVPLYRALYADRKTMKYGDRQLGRMRMEEGRSEKLKR